MAKKIKNTSKDLLFQKLSVVDGAKAYGQIREAVTKQGILKRAYGYYTFLMLFTFVGFFLSVYFIVVSHSLLSLLIWSLPFAFFTVQIGGLLHDAGHRAIFKTTLMNDIFGHFFGASVAIAYGSWKIKHNLHHAHTNQEDEDPDLEVPFSFTEDRYKGRRGIVGFIRKNQAYLYFPLGSLVWLSLRTSSMKFLLRNFKWKRLWEMGMFLLALGVWFLVPFIVFPLGKALFLLLFVNSLIGLYLLNVFAPNHKGMPQLGKGVRISFIEHQILTSRNIRGHWLTDFIFMGLNYQIEHHLFPNTPRNKLRLITPYVLAFCREKKMDYTNVSAWKSNKIILSELHHVSKTS